jgi:hypothetical protein
MNDWSPDGSEIVFHSIFEGGQRDVLIISENGILLHYRSRHWQRTMQKDFPNRRSAMALAE